MNALVYTAAQVAAMFPPELKMTEYWVNKTARRHGIGTVLRRKRTFTEAQIQELIAALADEAQQPRPARKANATRKARTAKAKPLPPATGNVTPLQPRPERARSYGSTS